MVFRRTSNQRGAALAIVLANLFVLGTVSAVLARAISSRRASVESLEARLEQVRIQREFSGALRSAAMDAAEGELGAVEPPVLAVHTSSWETNSNSVTAGFSADLLRSPRQAVAGGTRDPGAPGTLPWLVKYSETVDAQGELTLKRPAPFGGDDISSTTKVSTSLWRIPAPAVGLLVSSQPLTLDRINVFVGGVAVLCSGGAPAGLSSTHEFLNRGSVRVTAGAGVSNRVTQIYRDGAFILRIDDINNRPAGIGVAEVDGARLPVIDLANYGGPRILDVQGAATLGGVVLVGSASAGPAVSIACAGPLILAGPNERYVFAATEAREVGLHSSPQYDAAAAVWRLASGSPASYGGRWHGHIFIAAADPSFRVFENWAGVPFFLRGSLHLLGGRLATSGPGSGTLTRIEVGEPEWAEGAFSTALRHESFLATSTR